MTGRKLAVVAVEAGRIAVVVVKTVAEAAVDSRMLVAVV